MRYRVYCTSQTAGLDFKVYLHTDLRGGALHEQIKGRIINPGCLDWFTDSKRAAQLSHEDAMFVKNRVDPRLKPGIEPVIPPSAEPADGYQAEQLYRVWRYVPAKGKKEWFLAYKRGEELCNQLLAVHIDSRTTFGGDLYDWTLTGEGTTLTAHEVKRIFIRVRDSASTEYGVELVEPAKKTPVYRVWIESVDGKCRRWFTSEQRGEALQAMLAGHYIDYWRRPGDTIWFSVKEKASQLTCSEAHEVLSRIRGISCGAEPVDPPEELVPGMCPLPPKEEPRREHVIFSEWLGFINKVQTEVGEIYGWGPRDKAELFTYSEASKAANGWKLAPIAEVRHISSFEPDQWPEKPTNE